MAAVSMGGVIRRALPCLLASVIPLAGLGLTASQAATVAAPTRYSLIETFSLVVPGQILMIDRDGQKAVLVDIHPASANSPLVHTRSYYDLPAGRGLTVDLTTPAPSACTAFKFSGGWGDAFEMSAGFIAQLAQYHPTDAGMAVVRGIPTKIVEAATPDGRARFWIEPKTGLIVKWTNTPPSGPPRTILEVTAFSLSPRPAAAFVPPANCPKGG
jgi:hypothetical protein